MNRRDFIRLSALAAAGAALGVRAGDDGAADGAAAAPAAPPPPPADLFAAPPHVQLLDATTVGVVWMTAAPATGYVTWSQDDWATTHTAWREEDGLLDANTTLHRATLEGLDPTRPLAYRVHSRPFAHFGPYAVSWAGGEATREGRLRATLPPDPSGAVSWAMLNDVHQHLAVYDRLLPHLADVSTFCVLNGDIVNHVDDEALVVRCLLGPMARVSREAGLPVWYLRGNHETRGAFARRLRDYLSLKDGHYFGAVTLGGARFVFLDTGEDKADGHREYSGLVAYDRYLARQADWLRREVASAAWRGATARIVVQHIPAPTTIPHLEHGKWEWHPGLPRLDALNAVLREANVTLMMGAHLHNWNWHEPTAARPYPMIVGGGPGLGDPARHDNATLVKCRLADGALRVRLLTQDGAVALDHTLRCR